MKTTKLNKDFKKYLKEDIECLLHILSNDEELGYNSLAGIISNLKTTASSLNIKADKLQKDREKLDKLPI